MPATTHPRRRQNMPPARPSGATPADLAFFLSEQLLEARRDSRLPTNGDGLDEDVNIYLALRLAALGSDACDPRVVPGRAPLLEGPDRRLGRAQRADWYRANADHRLLTIGLFDRGDGLRRRVVPWGQPVDGNRDHELAVAAACYRSASSLLARGPDRGGTPARVLARLAERCDDYAQALGVLAVRRLGLGARLVDRDLATLSAPPMGEVRPANAGAAAAVRAVLATAPADAADLVLDLALEYRRTRADGLRQRIARLAPFAGLDARRLLALPAIATP